MHQWFLAIGNCELPLHVYNKLPDAVEVWEEKRCVQPAALETQECRLASIQLWGVCLEADGTATTEETSSPCDHLG